MHLICDLPTPSYILHATNVAQRIHLCFVSKIKSEQKNSANYIRNPEFEESCPVTGCVGMFACAQFDVPFSFEDGVKTM